MNQYSTQKDKIEELELVACNWDGEIWNRTVTALAAVWIATDGKASEGWNYLRAHRYIKKHLVDPCAKWETATTRSETSWAQRWTFEVRQEVSKEILDRMLDEFELENLPTKATKDLEIK